MSAKERRSSSRINASKSGKSSSRQEGLELFMECEDEELTPAQLEAAQQAEQEYQDAIHKINTLKSTNASVKDIATPQSTATVQPQIYNASSSSPNLIGSPRVAGVSSQAQQSQQYIAIPNAVPVQTLQSPPPGYKLLVDTRTGLIIGTMPPEGQAIITTPPQPPAPQNPLSPTRLHMIYGQPRRTSNKAHAVSLYESGKDVRDIANNMRISESAAEVYLIDSLFLGENLDYERLSQLLNISGDMMSHVLEVLVNHLQITLAELQHETLYSFNQIRLCIARLYRGFFWKTEEDEFRKGHFAF